MLINKKYSIRNKGERNIPFFERLLNSRNLTEEDLTKKIYHDPLLMNDINKASDKIISFIKNNKKITIFGDYDSDGVCATSILYKGLKDIGANINYYIPERLTEGYGMHLQACQKLYEDDTELVITVDNGIVAFDEVDFLISKGIEVIITDHHQTQNGKLPNAFAVIDNKREDNTYPFPDICGAFVAYKLLDCIYSKLCISGIEEFRKYAAIATITDVMPLSNENRSLVIEGLKDISNDESLNIEELCKAASKSKNSLTAMDIGFYIGPLINASSRVGSVKDAMNVLISDDAETIRKSAEKLKEYNELRKKIELEITQSAMEQVVKNGVSNGPIIVYGDNWHKGVIGIAASRLVDTFNRPAIVLSLIDGKYTGSCRSIEGIDIMEILNYAKEYIYGYGGHTGAAGLTIIPKDLNGFINKINEYSNNFLKDFDFTPVEKIEMEIFIDEITLDNYDKMKLLEPFGTQSNAEPVFICKNLLIKEIRLIGKNKEHLQITFGSKYSNIQIKAIGFFISEYYSLLFEGEEVDATFKLNKNEFNGRTSIQIMLKDIFASFEVDKTYKSLKEINFNIDKYIKEQKTLKIDRKLFYAVYLYILNLIDKNKYKIVVINKQILSNMIKKDILKSIDYIQTEIILDALNESGKISISNLENNNILIGNGGKFGKKISETTRYRSLY